MKMYEAFVDSVEKMDDWDYDEKINVSQVIVRAKDHLDARDKALEVIKKRNPEAHFYVWAVSEDDVLED